MRAVNLLPRDRTSAKAQGFGAGASKQLLLAGGGAAMLATIVGLVAVVWTSNSTVNSKQHQLGALQARIAKLPAPTPVSTSGATGTQARLTAVDSLTLQRLPWDGFLGAFARVIPEDVWVSTLQASSPGAANALAAVQAQAATAAAGATASSTSSTSSSTSATSPPPPATSSATPSAFLISGYTYSEPSVARLMRRLTLVPWLSNVALVSTTKATISSTTVYQFTVGATVVPSPEGAS